MKKRNFYIDQKCTVWVRYTVEIEAETKEEAEQKMIEMAKQNLPEVLIEAEDSETLYDTLDPMTPEDNGGRPTVEVMNPNQYNSIWDNGI